MAVIRTERLQLRSATMDDLAGFHAILSHPVAMAYWSTPPHQNLNQSRQWLRSMVDISVSQGEDFTIEHAGHLIGKAGFYRFPEIGFILHPGAWGRGFAAEALIPVLDRAFHLHSLTAIEADVDPRNEASRRLLTKLGFREIGRREKSWLVGDRWCDSVDLRLQAAEFRKQFQGAECPKWVES